MTDPQHDSPTRTQTMLRVATLLVVLGALGVVIGRSELRRPAAQIHLGRPGQSQDLLDSLDHAVAERPPGRANELLPGCTSEPADSSSCRVVAIGDDRRRALVLRPATKLETPIDAKGATAFRFSAATRGRNDELDVRITLTGGAEPRTWEQRVKSKDGWVDGSVPIPAGAPVDRLRIEIEAPTPKDSNAMLALAAPRLIRPAGERDAPGPRNIVLYLIDTLRADHTSVNGYARSTTPRLEALAKEGVVFERAYSTAARTRPATASLLTSLYPAQHQARLGRGLALEVETLAESLRDAGWSTWAFVANGHVFGRTLNFEQGFDRFETVRGAKLNNHARSEEINKVLLPQLRAFADEPFFLYVHAVDPHSPYEPPPGFAGSFADPGYDGKITSEQTHSRALERKELSDADLARVRDLYDEDVLYQDAMLGELLDELERLGLRDETLVIVVADHGEEFREHGRFEHGDRLYQEMLRIPLVMRVPGVPALAGTRVESPVSLVDVMPTLLGWYGIPVPAGTQGGDVTPLIAGARPAKREAIYSEEVTQKPDGDLRSIVDGSWKLIRRGSTSSDDESLATYQLFNLDEDPEEQVDHASSEPERLAAMQERLEARRKELSAGPARAEAPPEHLDARTRKQLEALGYVIEEPTRRTP